MSYKILVVDDSKLARMSVNKVLKALYPDWTQLEAANAHEAVSSMERALPDMALLDFNMPGGNGIDLVTELRGMNPSMPIAIISANHQQEVVKRAQALGATFLPKPITEEALSKFLHEAVLQLGKA